LSEYATIADMDADAPRPITITLSPAQVEEVVRAASASRSPALAILIDDSIQAADEAADGPSAPPADPRLSRSLVRGLSILARFAPETPERGVVELARELGLSPSTTHRYAQTLIELGLLERCPRTRKYRLPARQADRDAAGAARPSMLS
jgi:hypothetical protein